MIPPTMPESPTPAPEPGTRRRARLIIPVWGEKYVERLDIACLPAVLAPGNMPYLSTVFDCELAIVTQQSLFEKVRSLPSVQALTRYCRLVLIAMDDVLSHPSYYGFTITQSLHRGFAQLGEAAKETWCLFLNADFILADGCYRSMAQHMLAGERLIMAPSYCAIEEDVRPALEAAKPADGPPVLAMEKRVMADLILRHRHFSIRSKIINWRMYRIDRVDQFYYMVDNDTMLGRQLPIAIVAFRPENVPPKPVTFWDYGVVSEICPTSRLCVLGDSDEFTMLELRTRNTMSDQLQLGWMDPGEIARDLSIWTTKDQRDCGEHDLVLHRGDLPAALPAGRTALETYYRDIMRRVVPEPRDHRNHYIWTGQVQLHADWLRSRAEAARPAAADPAPAPEALRPLDAGTASPVDIRQAARQLVLALILLPFTRRGVAVVRRQFHDLARMVYRRVFGRLPEVGPLHPLAADLRPVVALLAALPGERAKALSVSSIPFAVVAPHLSRWFQRVTMAGVEDLSRERTLQALAAAGPFDLCFLELSREEFAGFGRLHAVLRGLVRKGGHLVVLYRTRGVEHVSARDFQLIANGLPECDLAELRFAGSPQGHRLQRRWDQELARVQSGRALGMLRFGLWAMVVAMPLALRAARAERFRPPQDFPEPVTSLLLDVTVI